MSEASDRLSRKCLLRGVLCAVAMLVIYAAFLQAVFFKVDGPYLVLRLDQDDLDHPYNLLYMPLVGWVHAVLSPLGASAYLSALVFSALGTAVGVGCVYVAFSRLAETSRHALSATALVAVCPPVFFFATVVEHHGPFFACVGLSFLLAVEFERRPGVVRAVILGLSMILAYSVHSTGILLPWLWLTAFVARRLDGRLSRKDLALAILAGVVSSLALFDVLRVDAGQALREGIGQPKGIGYLTQVVWEEWLWPYLPISLLWFGVFRLREIRLEAWAFVVGVVPYLALCLLLIVGEPEFGAYVLPVVVPMAGFVVRLVRRAWVWGVVVLSLLLAVYHVWAHDEDSTYRAWVRGMTEVVAETDILFLGGTDEIAMWLATVPSREALFTSRLAGITDAARYPELLAQFDAGVAHWHATGKAVWFSIGGRRELENPKLPFGRVLLDHIEAEYRPITVSKDGFSAWQLR